MGQWRRGRSKKRIRATAVRQLFLIFEDQELKEPADPYLQMWLMCKKYGDGVSGRPSLPFSGTVLEQDAELMLAFDLFEEAKQEFDETKKERKEQQDKLEAEYGIKIPEGF